MDDELSRRLKEVEERERRVAERERRLEEREKAFEAEMAKVNKTCDGSSVGFEELLLQALPQIAEMLSVRDLCRVSQCSHALREAAAVDALWVPHLCRCGAVRAWRKEQSTARDFYAHVAVFPRVGDLARARRFSLGDVVRVVVRVGPLALCDLRLAEFEDDDDAATAVAAEDLQWVLARDLVPLAVGDVAHALSYRHTAQRQMHRFRRAEATALALLRAAVDGYAEWPAVSVLRVDATDSHAGIVQLREGDDVARIAVPQGWERFHAPPPVVQCAAAVLAEMPPVGARMNVLDTVDHWYGGTVLAVDAAEAKIFVKYEGWSEKWHEWISFTDECHRFAPLPVGLGYVHFGGARTITERWDRAPLCKFISWGDAVAAPWFSWSLWLHDPAVPVDAEPGQLVEALVPTGGWFAAIVRSVHRNEISVEFDGMMGRTSTFVMPRDALMLRPFDPSRAVRGTSEPVFVWENHPRLVFSVPDQQRPL